MEEKTLQQTKEIVRADEIIGVQVINTAGEHLGSIYQICLDKLTGKVICLVLESGSFLGLGGKLFSLPWHAIHYDPEEEAFILDISKERLKNAPGFDKDHWPQIVDERFNKRIADFYAKK